MGRGCPRNRSLGHARTDRTACGGRRARQHRASGKPCAGDVQRAQTRARAQRHQL